MAELNALFVQEDDIFTPTNLAHGPWGAQMLHGGATGGLMAHVLEQCAPKPDMQLVRTTLDMFRPVPMSPLRVETKILRDGKRLQVIEASLYASDKLVARSVGVRMKVVDVEVPVEYQPEKATPEGPEGLEELKFAPGAEGGARLPGLNSNLEIRRLYGFDGKGEGCSWIKAPVPVVDGVKTSPFVHLGVVSDFGNGLAQLFLPGTVGMINADINLYIHRNPVSDWIALKSKAVMSDSGTGVVNSEFYDKEGLIAQSHQAVMVQTQ